MKRCHRLRARPAPGESLVRQRPSRQSSSRPRGALHPWPGGQHGFTSSGYPMDPGRTRSPPAVVTDPTSRAGATRRSDEARSGSVEPSPTIAVTRPAPSQHDDRGEHQAERDRQRHGGPGVPVLRLAKQDWQHEHGHERLDDDGDAGDRSATAAAHTAAAPGGRRAPETGRPRCTPPTRWPRRRPRSQPSCPGGYPLSAGERPVVSLVRGG